MPGNNRGCFNNLTFPVKTSIPPGFCLAFFQNSMFITFKEEPGFVVPFFVWSWICCFFFRLFWQCVGLEEDDLLAISSHYFVMETKRPDMYLRDLVSWPTVQAVASWVFYHRGGAKHRELSTVGKDVGPRKCRLVGF